jgi:hypothetical protein
VEDRYTLTGTRECVNVLAASADREQSVNVVELANGADSQTIRTSNVEHRPYRLFSAAELDRLPALEWIIDRAIPGNSLVGLIGPKGHMKTFVALDLALHVATGLAWHGRGVRPAAVVYIYAEGPHGARSRIDAWCAHWAQASGCPLSRGELPLWLLPRRIPINDTIALGLFITEIKQLEPVPTLIVIDTLNQNLDGDEDGRGMGGFVAGCCRIRDEFGATVMAVHHTPLGSEERGRGHTSFDGAIDTRLNIRAAANRVTLKCTHQRNAENGWSVTYEAIPVADSLVLRPSGQLGEKLEGQRRAIAELLDRLGPLTYSCWLRESRLQKSSFNKARNWLKEHELVRQDNKIWILTDPGLAALRSTASTGGSP